MGLPELTKKQIESILGAFCNERVPSHLRNKVRLIFTFEDDSVFLIEERPVYNDPSRWTQGFVAQFRFDLESKTWTLFCQDRNLKWHPYQRVKPSRTFNHLLQEVKNDPTGIFWG